MSKYRKLWVDVQNKFVIPEQPFDHDVDDGRYIVMIELAALEACQKRLDEAVILLKLANWYVEVGNEEDQNIKDQIDTFLSQIKDVGE